MLKKDISKSIKFFEKCLRINPEHKKAKEFFLSLENNNDTK